MLEPQSKKYPGLPRTSYCFDFSGNSTTALIVVTVSLSGLVGTLLYVVFRYQVEQCNAISPNLSLPTDQQDTLAYYVNYSGTRLTTLALWISNFASILPGSVMTLFPYCLAKQLEQQHENSIHDLRPTPYQLALLINSLSGKLMSVWQWLTYLPWRRREKLSLYLRLHFAITFDGVIVEVSHPDIFPQYLFSNEF